MTHTIEVLRQEHIGMARLLRLMDKLWREISDGQPPDYPLLNEISDYLRGYPDQCHHPKEDLIYRKLGERDPDLQELGDDLEYEHARLTTRRSCWKYRPAMRPGRFGVHTVTSKAVYNAEVGGSR